MSKVRHFLARLQQLLCSWRKSHDIEEFLTADYAYCRRCGRGWFYDRPFRMWRRDTENPNLNP